MPLLSPHLFLHRPKKLFISLTPAGKSAFFRAAERQARPCSLSARIKEQRLAPRPRKATKKKQALITPYYFVYTLKPPKSA